LLSLLVLFIIPQAAFVSKSET